MIDFDRMTSLASLWAAARRAARGKRLRPSVARTLFDLEGTVLRLQTALRDGQWTPGRASRHEIRDPKRRIIAAAPFEDRIVHQALCAEIGPALDRHLIAHTYACRVGLGTHAAVRQARVWARAHRFFVHLDVTKFFPSIDHDILMAMLRRDIGCARTLALCERIVRAGTPDSVRFHFAGDDLFAPLARGVGLPIGNLTSQHFANRYLSPVDHRAKDRLRVRAYLRYMDDMLFFGDDRETLAGHGRALEEACHRQRLRLHPWEVQPTRAGVGWLGFHILPRETRVKRSSVARAKKRLHRLQAEATTKAARERFLMSPTFAHWDHGTTWRLREQTLRELGILAEEEGEADVEAEQEEEDD